MFSTNYLSETAASLCLCLPSMKLLLSGVCLQSSHLLPQPMPPWLQTFPSLFAFKQDLPD